MRSKNRNVLVQMLITVTDLKYLPESELAELELRSAELESEILGVLQDFQKHYPHLEIDSKFTL